MSAPKGETPIFKPDANATPVSDLKAPAPDARRERVHRVHGQILRGTQTGDIYRGGKKKRFS